MITEIRAATPEDVRHLAQFLLMATGGLMDALYHDLVPGKSTRELVERRFLREGTTWYYRNHWVAVCEGQVAGGLHAYAQDDAAANPPDPIIPKERLVLLDHYNHLKAPHSFEINVVAVYPRFRRRGVGARLLSLARAEAKARSFSRLSLYVFEQNDAAVRLYRSHGFEISGRYLAAAHSLIRMSGDIALMTCAV
jgi:ribosomal protein S18 acetylase RimI-like enzyme